MENTQQQTPPQGSKKNTGMALLAYIVFFIPLLTDAKNDSFVKYHVKQGLVLFIFAVIAWFIVMAIPVFGLILSPFLNLAVIIFAIIGIMNAMKGVEKPLPLIGQFSSKLNF